MPSPKPQVPTYVGAVWNPKDNTVDYTFTGNDEATVRQLTRECYMLNFEDELDPHRQAMWDVFKTTRDLPSERPDPTWAVGYLDYLERDARLEVVSAPSWLEALRKVSEAHYKRVHSCATYEEAREIAKGGDWVLKIIKIEG